LFVTNLRHTPGTKVLFYNLVRPIDETISIFFEKNLPLHLVFVHVLARKIPEKNIITRVKFEKFAFAFVCNDLSEQYCVEIIVAWCLSG
jgi:hypothetical protein